MLPEAPHSKAKRLRYLKLQYSFYCFNVIAGLLGMIPIVVLAPRFPQFVNSVWLPDPNLNQTSAAFKPMVEEIFGTSYGIEALTYIFAFYDVVMSYNTWQPIATFDIAVTMVTRTMANGIGRIHQALLYGKGNFNELLTLYNSIRILSQEMTLILGGIIFVQEMMSLVCHVTCIFAAFQTSGTLLSLFFIHVSITFLVKMYLVYLPFVQLLHKSIQLRRYLQYRYKLTIPEQLGPNYKKQIWKLIGTIRTIYVRPLGLHRLTHTSITDYVLAAFSYVVAIKKT